MSQKEANIVLENLYSLHNYCDFLSQTELQQPFAPITWTGTIRSQLGSILSILRVPTHSVMKLTFFKLKRILEPNFQTYWAFCPNIDIIFCYFVLRSPFENDLIFLAMKIRMLGGMKRRYNKSKGKNIRTAEICCTDCTVSIIAWSAPWS